MFELDDDIDIRVGIHIVEVHRQLGMAGKGHPRQQQENYGSQCETFDLVFLSAPLAVIAAATILRLIVFVTS